MQGYIQSEFQTKCRSSVGGGVGWGGGSFTGATVARRDARTGRS